MSAEYRIVKVATPNGTTHYQIERRVRVFGVFVVWSTVDQPAGYFTTWGPYQFDTREHAEEAITILKTPETREVLEN